MDRAWQSTKFLPHRGSAIPDLVACLVTHENEALSPTPTDSAQSSSIQGKGSVRSLYQLEHCHKHIIALGLFEVCPSRSHPPHSPNSATRRSATGKIEWVYSTEISKLSDITSQHYCSNLLACRGSFEKAPGLSMHKRFSANSYNCSTSAVRGRSSSYLPITEGACTSVHTGMYEPCERPNKSISRTCAFFELAPPINKSARIFLAALL